MNITCPNNSCWIIALTDFEYILFRCLIFFEFLCILLAYFSAFIAIYLIMKIPQFHFNLNGLLCNMCVADIIVLSCRVLTIFIVKFEPWPMALLLQSEQERTPMAINTYYFILFSTIFERTLASIMLEKYENFKNPVFLIIFIPLQWICGARVDRLITYNYISGLTWLICTGTITIFAIVWLIILHFYNKYRYKHSDSRAYSLRERYQISENIKFLNLVKWVSATIVLGNMAPIFILIFLLSPRKYDYIKDVVYNFMVLFIGISVPIVAVFTNTVWKRELFRLTKQFHVKIMPWKNDLSNEKSHRFNAPYLRTLTGKPMVFSQEEEKELYFKFLQTQLT